jgi:hypothetical protein
MQPIAPGIGNGRIRCNLERAKVKERQASGKAGK